MSSEAEDEEARGSNSELLENCPEEDVLKLKGNSENFKLKAEEYLNSDDVKYCTDPKLKRERQKLEDLLKSYKKLINKLDSKFQTEEDKIAEEKRISRVPEIYAILHPELYKNPREDEKTKLIKNFSRRRFSSTDRVVPPTCRTPIINVLDKRQEEKERFIKIISSCPARFLNSCDAPLPQKKLRRPNYISLSPCVKDDRELEKERLCKILSSSGIYYRKNLDKKLNPISNRRVSQENTPHCTDSDLGSSVNQSKEKMVRVGEYSPLSSKEIHPTLRGFGEVVEKPRYLTVDRRALRKNLSQAREVKVDQGISTSDLEEVDDGNDDVQEPGNDSPSRKRCSSISTQTDPSDISQENKEDIVQMCSPRGGDTQQKVHYLSPREQLMSDLHGVSHCFPGGSSKVSPRGGDLQDVKLRQVAYAKALKEQIEEKKRLEELRRRKDKEEEELMEQRIRLQQERLEHELNDEQKKKEDWMAQRQSHEEVLRRKMLEMELEAQELKKLERKKRRDSDNVSEVPLRQSPFMKPPQTTRSESSSQPNPPEYERRNTREKRFDALKLTPLLDADRQNVLSFQSRPIPFLSADSPGLRVNGDCYREEHKVLDKKRAENLLKAPLDFHINRPPSPPIPAVRTRSILNTNTKLLDEKWQVPKEGKELLRSQVNSGRDNILTQLGAFRRQLVQEHVKLEERLQKQQSP